MAGGGGGGGWCGRRAARGAIWALTCGGPWGGGEADGRLEKFGLFSLILLSGTLYTVILS